MTRVLIITFCVLVVMRTDAGQGDERFRSGKTVRADAAGVKFRGFLNLRSKPLTAVNAYPLRRRDGKRVEAFDRNALWIRSQCLGRWGNEAGTVVLARPTLPPPDTIPIVYEWRGAPLTTKALFDEWTTKNAAGAMDAETRRRWVEAFTGLPFEGAPQRVKRDVPYDAVVHRHVPKNKSNGVWVYEIQSREAEPPLFFICQLNSGNDPHRSDQAVKRSLKSIEFFEPTVDEDKRLNVHGVDKVDPDWTDEYAASRERVIGNIQNFKDWWYLPADNFIVVSNESNKRTIREILESLESCRRIFNDFYPITDKPKAVSVCRVFAEKEGYRDYAGAALAWSIGFWAAGRKELVVSPLDWGSSSMRRRALAEVLYHEGFHQYIHYASGERPTAVWFNEGNATFFEGLEIESDGDYKIKPTERAKLLNRLAKAGPLPVKPFLLMSLDAFQSGNLPANYAMVWGIVFFLRKGCQIIDKEDEYGSILSRYYDAVRKTGNPSMATAIAWRDVDIKQFTNDITEFYKNSGKLRKAARLKAIPYVKRERNP